MPRGRAPFWLAEPTRFARLKPRQAWLALAALALVLLASLSAVGAAGEIASARPGMDASIGQTIVDGVRHNGGYYSTAASALRGADRPLRPFTVFPFPTLSVVEGWLPGVAAAALFYALALAVLLVWTARLRGSVRSGAATVAALALLAAGMAEVVAGDAIYSHDLWAGLLIALSLALRRPGRWIEPVAIALIAMLIRETALVYALVMALFALLEGRRREAAGWGVAIAVFAVVLALHAHAVDAVVGPLDVAASDWGGRLGFGFFVAALTQSTALALLPVVAGALIAGCALFGWAAWNDDAGLRALALIAACAALIGIAAEPGDCDAVLIVAPLLLLGLVFVPDALGDLARAALDKRRITVTRVRP
jgi:hypothetical protein